MTRRRNIAVAVAAAAALAVVVPLALGAFLSSSMGDQPVRTPQMRILAPTGVIHPGDPIPVQVQFSDFDFQPALRCGPAGPCTGSSPQTLGPGGIAQGHIHVYIQGPGTGIAATADSVSFCIPPTAVNNVATGTCPAVAERGEYRVTAEFQSNSHVNVLKAPNSPQDVPTSDAIVIRVA